MDAALSRASTTSATCPSEDEILAFADGTLSADEAAAIHVHADACVACRLLLAELGRLGDPARPATTSGAGAGVPVTREGSIIGGR